MQQPQSRPLLGDSVSSTTSPTARRSNPVAVLTHQQLQQLQQLQAQNSSGQSLTFALQQASNNPQDQGNGSTTGNHIVYVNQLNHLNQGTINPSGTGMGLPPATPTFGVGLNMGLPLSLLNTSLTSLTSNVITTSNPLLNLGLPSINTGLTTINPSLNHLNAINSNLTPNIGSSSINNGLSGLGQDLNSINTGINRLNTLNSTNISSGLSSVNTGINNVNPNLTSLNSNINQNLTSLSTNFTSPSSGVSGLTAINPTINANLTTTSINSGITQGLNRPVNALTTGLTQTSLNSSSTQFPFQAIQSIQSIAPHIVGSNIAHVPSSAISQHPNSNVSTISQISNSGTLTSSSIFTSTSSEPIHSTTTNVNHGSNVNLTTNIPHLGTMHSNLSNVSTSNVQHISASNEPNMPLNHSSSLSSSQSTGFQPQRQYSQGINPGLSSSVTLTGSSQPSNVASTINTVKSMQNIQSQNISSPSSPFSIPLKSPASNIAPPTPSPSPNRLLLRSPASNSIQSNRNSPSPVGTSTSNNFNIQMQSPMQSPMSQIQSPVLSPYPPAKSPHLLSGNNSLNNRSPAPGGSPGPPVVRPNTPILQQGMQVLQIIHGTPQGYQSTPTQLVTRTHLIGNQQIQIAATKPAKQPPQILPKPPNQHPATGSQQKQQRVTTTITNQVTQQTQPQLVLAGPQPNPTTATMIPTAQGLLLNQVLPSTGPVIVQQQPGGVQLILRTPASAQQQTHTAQLTQQQLVRVVTAQGMQLQGITPTFFAVPNGFPPAASPVIRHTPSSPAPSANSGTGNPIVIQNAMVQSPQPQISQVGSSANTSNTPCSQTVVEQTLLPPPKKKAKKKKKAKRKDDEPPKLDLASIMKISGIGDDDDIFDTDLTTESDVPCQVQVESNTGQNLGQLSSQLTIPNSSAQNLIQVPAPNTTNTQSSVSQTFNSHLVTQLQMPVQNTIQGQLRFAVGEDGRVVLHRTPELNQPEMDQATAQALIRSLTQGGGQNSPIISHLLGQAQTTSQSTQSTVLQRQKFVKSPSSSSVSTVTTTVTPAGSQSVTCATSPQHVQICSKSNNQQKSVNVPQESNPVLNVCVQSNLASLQTLDMQASKSINVQSLTPISKTNQSSNSSLPQLNSNVLTSDVLSSKPSHATFSVQNSRLANTSQASSNQQNSNVSTQKSSQVRLTSVTTNVRQNLNKISQGGVHVSKSLPNSLTIQGEHNITKNNQNPQESITLQQETPIYQHNQQQQVTAQTVQTQNVQHVFEQNLQSSGSNAQHNSVNMLQQQSSCNTMQHDTMNVLQHSSIQQNTINVLQQNAAGNVQNIEQNLQPGISDVAQAQQNVATSMQQQNTSAVLHNASVQQNVNVQQQKVVAANTFSSVNAHQFESQNAVNAMQQGLSTQQNNQHQNIVITNAPPSNTIQQNESQKVENQSTTMLNSAANNILNNAPKITPEILNALSNLNPNDQLLIANANGQMQVISQQLLQQFLAGQLNATNQVQNQNQTQKIVIGEPDANNQNLQGVQINTPTSQIIVNSSGGAPTIQNNIQNIVVQAAPSQMPQHIQIQNSNFPSQFIDNLNQQQIRNLGTSQPKKTKIVKKTKTVVTSQNAGNTQVTKTVTVTRPTMISTNTSNFQKADNSSKANTVTSQSTNPVKSESSQIVTNGPVLPPSPGGHLSIPSNGQMVQRVQTIQLPAPKQQLLKNIQSQIQAILARKSGSQPDQTVLTKLYQEQSKILASGKVVSTTTHSVSSGSETSFNVNAVSTIASNLMSQNSYKNQTSAVQTQTQTSTTVLASQTLNSNTPTTVQNNTPSNYMNSLTIPQNVQGQQCVQNNQNVHQTHTKQHKIYQNHGNQILSPSSANMQIFSPPITSITTVQSNAQQLTTVQTQQTGMQQSTQCQTDPLDIKPNIPISSPVKQELSSPIQVQVQSGSPAGQVASPRMIGKGPQRIQSPVNTNSNLNKQSVSPGSNSSPLVSPRQAVKRPATSPICRQINRSDLLEQQLKIDQNGAINPDVNTPFLSKRDACKRLVRYHCLNEQVLSSKDLAKADEIFEETAKHLLSKFNSMMNKYTYLLLMESMREVRTSELMMIDRTFVAEEQSILNRLREQEAKVNEEFKKEEKPLVPKVEPGLAEEDKLSSSLTNVSVKRELEDDFPSDEMECKPVIKSASCTSGDYDEWLEIQKELGVYPSTTDSFKCKNSNNSGNNSASAVAVTRSSKTERTRANGECRTNVPGASVSGVQHTVIKDNCEQDNTPVFERRWSCAPDLERDLLEDADSLDGLALHSQTQCPGSLVTTESGNGNEHDDITAQVQSAIDSILNLKKRPTNTLPGSNGNSASQSSESKDTVLDQAVRSILGS
ncbi:mucin-4-like isoform X1 [Osmia bicornis bicornis]|uniref:mucin-4-like isoform X1 n=1 Tax=Osmia bicornis bicornis TaxID=1437191 RepID=UPI0010F79DBF|nr:mucin-4-like isoform X1 [Osmia bicornis bicornis]XP_029052523.1 mucin-4-like isoform X1 [Osmia bicornis bicornis]